NMEALRKNHNRLISLKQAKRLLIALVFIFSFDLLLFPASVMADQIVEDANLNQEQAVLVENVVEEDLSFINQLPESKDLKVKESSYRVITAYNSEAGQTDNSPCITANGFNVCKHGIEDTVAANFLSFGTKVKIPELFGDRVFIVRDRMNTRFSDRVDIWMLNKAQAIKLGVKYAKVEVLK
ncbi:3D domain-containing protein, partial [Patescibacteria group bacterium]|nr:3D domain-containing protein [Patescibacteria group bacterium]